jgi:hypothetical protein
MSDTATLAPNVREHTGAATVTACGACGATLPPSGACLSIGVCVDADEYATRGAAGSTAKYAVPAAWNVRGGVD